MYSVVCGGNTMRANRWQVDFPHQLDMRSYSVGVPPRKPYELYAVSNHYGTMSGGHYTAFCKNVYQQRFVRKLVIR